MLISKPVKKVYRILIWFFSAVVAAGTFAGCVGGCTTGASKYGPPTASYSKPKRDAKTEFVKVKDSIPTTRDME